ncbi:MAG: hypothetical protein FWH07_06105 [Oscillospiraceae bacterium]|nr:hypothetical protein [Oscillospiraceae bacterium]
MKKIITIIICLGLGVIIILDSSGIRAAAVDGIQLSLNTIVPSLFAFLALSVFVMSSGIIKGDLAVFILSMAGGYPIGAKLLSDSAVKNPAYKKRAEHMMMYCFCGSPALLVAITDFGLYIWLSNVIACIIFAALANIRRQSCALRNEHSRQTESQTYNLDGSLVRAVTAAGGALYRICLMVVLFAIALRILEFTGVMKFLPECLLPILEITTLTDINANPALIAALTSLGGVCVVFQIRAITGKTLCLNKFLLARIPIAALSAAICWVFTRNIAVETIASPRTAISSSGSVTASACLMIMTLMLMKTVHNRETNT